LNLPESPGVGLGRAGPSRAEPTNVEKGRRTMTDDKKSARDKVSDGIKQGIGVLTAFKDALEETINEARERGDLSSERAKEVMKDALHKAHEAAEGARDRLDFVSQKEFDGLAAGVERIKERLGALEARMKGAEPSGDALDAEDGEAEKG